VAKLKWDELTYSELSSALSRGVDSVVFPVGTVEPHGAHLPLGTDTIIAEVVGELVAERVGALLLPALPYGVTGSLHGYPGSVRVPPDVLEALVLSVLETRVVARREVRAAAERARGRTRRAWSLRRGRPGTGAGWPPWWWTGGLSLGSGV